MSSISFNPSVTPSESILRRGEDSSARQVEPANITRAPDQVEFSAAARQAAADSPVRLDLVTKVREQIANGTYETPGRIAIATDELTKALRNG